MKKNLYILALFLIIVGCNQTKSNWIKAKHSNSVAEIKKFLNENPNSQYDNNAKKLLDSLEWVNALDSNSVTVYKSFINNYPNSIKKENASKILDSLEWENALNMNSEEGYKVYIKSYPNSKFYSEAKSKIPSELSGVAFIVVEFKNGSGFFADAVNVFYFIDVENCKKYVLDNRATNSFKLSSEATPCKIVGFIKKDLIICTSISTNLEESVRKSIRDSYTKNCKVK
jgi:hypothetical protein